MAMYYYASKISAIACGTRCRQNVLQKSRGQRDRDKHSTFVNFENCSSESELNNYQHKVSSSIKIKSPESSCSGTSNKNHIEKPLPDIEEMNLEYSALGPDEIMYVNGRIASGSLISLIGLLSSSTVDHIDKEFIFSFLLSSRFFIRPHELMGKLLNSVPDNEKLDHIVELLGIWTKQFPYDFRDERIMMHVKHIVCRCSNTGLEGVVSDTLSALLNRLTHLEQHEKDIRACHQNSIEKTDFIKCSTPSQLAQILCRIEQKLAKHVGPEEFVQCSNNIVRDKNSSKWQHVMALGGPPGNQDSKKTCNLETYLEWTARLRLFICNQILQCSETQKRSKLVELWSGAAQYCLLVGNYNSATAILESLESPSIARLKETWSNLMSTCQQLDCMLRHAEGCGDLWKKQITILATSNNGIKTASGIGQEKPKDWVVVPVFSDIVKLVLSVREECLNELPNGHLNIRAFNRLAAIVRAFTEHMRGIKPHTLNTGEYEGFCHHMEKTLILNESELMMASFKCEQPTNAEKLMYDLAQL